MRLLNARSLELEEFFEEYAPRYAILSHTWGKEEVLFKDIEQEGDEQKEKYRQKEGFRKIEGCAERAIRNGLNYIWADTCCIDKSSSAELSEAINSMFRWYRQSAVCYAYLSDVHGDYAPHDVRDDEFWGVERDLSELENPTNEFCRSRWFTRGWTLQELLAPRRVVFFNSAWKVLAIKNTDLLHRAPDKTLSYKTDGALISKVTSISAKILDMSEEILDQSIAERMRWAAERSTTRKEDEAYCLLGLLGVNIPLLYGEGDRAFSRLCEEIMKRSEDQSLLAGGLGLSVDDRRLRGERAAFPTSAASFQLCRNLNDTSVDRLLTHSEGDPLPPWAMTSRGLQITLPLFTFPDFPGTTYGILACGNAAGSLVLPLVERLGSVFVRPLATVPFWIDNRRVYLDENMLRPPLGPPLGVPRTIYIPMRRENFVRLGLVCFAYHALARRGYKLTEWHPPQFVGPGTSRCNIEYQRGQARVLSFSSPDLETVQVFVLFHPTDEEGGEDILDDRIPTPLFGFRKQRQGRILDILGTWELPRIDAEFVRSQCTHITRIRTGDSIVALEMMFWWDDLWKGFIIHEKVEATGAQHVI